MKAFTGNKDIDLKIIQNLKDEDIPAICRVNKYVSKLCEDENFWLNRLLNKSKIHIEDLKKIKGNLTYKKLYKYLYLGDYGEGLFHSIQNDNVYLYKLIPINKNSGSMLTHAACFYSIEIINYIFLNELHYFDDKDIFKSYMYTIGHEKTISWMDKMDLINYSDFITSWLFEIDEDFVKDNYIYEIIKKYLHKVENTDDFMFYLGDSLKYSKLESREKIFDLFLENNIDVDNYECAIIEAKIVVEDKNKLNKWVNYINNKMKKSNN